MLAIAVDGYNVPLWMASASLSGISMLNSCRESVSCYYSSPSHRKNAYLLNGHHDLNNIEAVQAQVVCEVGSSVNLSIPCQTIRISSKHLALNYLSSERKNEPCRHRKPICTENISVSVVPESEKLYTPYQSSSTSSLYGPQPPPWRD